METTEKEEINVFKDNKTNTCINRDISIISIHNFRKHEINKNIIDKNELNLLNKDIPKELINNQKPFGNSLSIKNKSIRLYLNNNKHIGSTIYNLPNEDSLIKPINKFNICDNDTALNETLFSSNNHSSKENYLSNEQPLVYPINKKKQTFLAEYQTLAVNTTKEHILTQKKDCFMNIYRNISFNTKKIKSISDKVHKLYYPNKKQIIDKNPLKNNRNYFYIRSISPLLSRKKKQDKKEKKSYIKSVFEKENLYNEILFKAKRESEMISQKTNVNRSQKNIMSRYKLQNDNELNEIEEQINNLINKKNNINCEKDVKNKNCDNDIKLKIEKQMEELTSIKNEFNDNIGEAINLNSDFSNDNDCNNQIEI